MSAIYNLEPQPTGSVIIHTTQGELQVELWAKQTPLTCRNFLQHAIDGYYDGTIFHRLVPGFILQGGDPTGTGSGGESIYDGGAFAGEDDPWPMEQRTGENAGPHGVGFKDEFHSRLRFNRRGLLGMANEGKPNTNASQFFFTLGSAEELTNKNTLFGRIAGDTIYNLAKMGEAEVDEGTERPLFPVKITRIEVLVNPFPDIKKRVRVAPVAPRPVAVDKKKKRRVGKQLLSFGGDDDDGAEPAVKKMKVDSRIVIDEEPQEPKVVASRPRVKDEAMQKEPKAKDGRASEDEHAPVQRRKEEPKAKAKDRRSPEDEHVPVQRKKEESKAKDRKSPDGEHDLAKRKEEAPEPSKYDEESEDETDDEEARRRAHLEKIEAEIAATKASMRRTIHTEQAAVKEKPKSILESMIPPTATRATKRRPGGASLTDGDPRTISILKAFQSRLDRAPPEKEKAKDGGRAHLKGGDGEADASSGGQKGADEEADLCDLHFIANCQSCRAWTSAADDEKAAAEKDDDDEGWLSHRLDCEADKLGKDLSYRKKAEEELLVIDPRARAERMFQDQKQAGREGRRGGPSGGRDWDRNRGGRDWDRDRKRNAAMAREQGMGSAR